MTEKTFKDRWLEAVDRKNSVLCAGLDPAEFDLGRGEEGLSKGVKKEDWAFRYVEAVAPFAAAVKPNVQYWKDRGDMETLFEIGEIAHDHGMVIIDDSKLADIGSTNDAGVFYASKRADAVTFSPFAGNLEEAAKQARSRGVGLIPMVLMSNPEYEREKLKLVKIREGDDYLERDIHHLQTQGIDIGMFVHQYLQLAHDADFYGAAGIVIGAPSKKNHIKPCELKKVREYVDPSMLVLLPGIGAQGGEANEIWKHFDRNNVIVNVGRSLMLPNGSSSTAKNQADAAKEYQEMLNGLRKAV